jgi:hypothetical protein
MALSLNNSRSGVFGGQMAGTTPWSSRFFLQHFKPLQKTYCLRRLADLPPVFRIAFMVGFMAKARKKASKAAQLTA